ncbi:MAG TPA: amylo-alpha-1,6-glucosidase [Nitrospiraceae bacterium]|nr:amylo-alpha-1,6-glucosidase [Nitrospiraceae bacterium]
MRIEKADCQNLDRALSLEWLETNGRGGFASGTVAGANTRRYHALLLTARKPPSERIVLVNHLEEWLDIDGQTIPLSTNLYPGTVHPSGYKRCMEFSTDPWPTWIFDCNGVTVQREILSIHGRDIVLVRWKLVGKTKSRAVLLVRPKLTGRDYHGTHHENGSLSTEAQVGSGRVLWQPYSDLPPVRAFHSGGYRHEPDWFRHIQFPIERQRGLDAEEDWWSPGELTFDLESGSAKTLAFTSETIDRLDVAALMKQEKSRRDTVRQAAPVADSLAGELWRAADMYISERGIQQTVIAGYPWFADWGRDTCISLPGLCLVTGRLDVAWQVIESFSTHVSEGMVPNRFPDIGEQPEYNTIDASLWFIHAIDRYLAASRDEVRVRETAWPAVKQILDGYRRGTRYGISMDEDGLITGGVPGAQLTWMDAKVGDWVVTPRHGKPVEIQALWVRALEVGEALARGFGEADYADRCRSDRSKAVVSFRKRFWCEQGGYLYDVIDGPEGDDASLRPNQLYAISLVDELVPHDRAQQILRLVKEQLLTPVGLRTLSPTDSRYRARYEGGVLERDSAYHQGTVWPFLLGSFVTAWIKVYGKNASALKQARSFLDGIDAHVKEACLGQVSEIFDAEAPHAPRGCYAQAWSVAESLRVLIEDLGIKPDMQKVAVKRVVVRQRKETTPQPTQRKGGKRLRRGRGEDASPNP